MSIVKEDVRLLVCEAVGETDGDCDAVFELLKDNEVVAGSDGVAVREREWVTERGSVSDCDRVRLLLTVRVIDGVLDLVTFLLADIDASGDTVNELVDDATGERLTDCDFVCVCGKDFERERVEDCPDDIDELLVVLSDHLGVAVLDAVRLLLTVPVFGNVADIVTLLLTESDTSRDCVDEFVSVASRERLPDWVFVGVDDRGMERERVEDCPDDIDELLVVLSDHVGVAVLDAVRLLLTVPVFGNVADVVTLSLIDTDACSDSEDELVATAVFVAVCEGDFDDVLAVVKDRVAVAVVDVVRVLLTVTTLDAVTVRVAFLLSETDVSGDFVGELVATADFVEVCEGDFDDVLDGHSDRVTVLVMDIV